jgi:hypothetical protein
MLNIGAGQQYRPEFDLFKGKWFPRLVINHAGILRLLTFANDRGIRILQMNLAGGNSQRSHTAARKCARGFMPLIFVRFWRKLKHRQILMEVLNVKFRGNPFTLSRVVTFWQTDGHCDFIGRSQMCESARNCQECNLWTPRYKIHLESPCFYAVICM